jgi:hypothetical protein
VVGFTGWKQHVGRLHEDRRNLLACPGKEELASRKEWGRLSINDQAKSLTEMMLTAKTTGKAKTLPEVDAVLVNCGLDRDRRRADARALSSERQGWGVD